MAIKITEECINCGACEPECPNNAIYEAGAEWNFAAGTKLKGTVPGMNGSSVDADKYHEPVSDEFYYIVSEKCTECKGFHEEPQCAAVCPVDCCLPDLLKEESEGELLTKKGWMHDN